MISSKKDLKETLNYEKKLYVDKSIKEKFVQFITKDQKILIWKYIKLLRKTEYFYNKKKNIFRNVVYTYYRRRKNVLGLKLGIEIWENSFDKGLLIFHGGSIVVNGNARVGKNCKLHGDNCIGNNGINNQCPILGDNVDIGVGAKVIGNIKIADNIKIGAGAVVSKSFEENGITILGVPARKK